MSYFLRQIIYLSVMLFSYFCFGQAKVKSHIIEGNNYYQKGKFDNAEYSYKKATAEDPTSVKGNYNLGNALFQQKRYKESITHYKKSADISKTKEDKHSAYHNLGNAYMQEKDYQNAVETYKQALKNNPKDDATRYNYALAKKMLEKDQKDQKNQNNKDKKKDQSKQDQKDQNNSEQNKQQNQNQNQAKDQKSEQQKQGNNPKPGGNDEKGKGQGDNSSSEMNKGNEGKDKKQDNNQNNINESLLKALQNQEAKTQRKIIQQKAEKQRTTASKDW